MYKIIVNDTWLSVESDEISYTCRLDDVCALYTEVSEDGDNLYALRMTVAPGGDPRVTKFIARAKTERDIQRYYRRTIRAIMQVRDQGRQYFAPRYEDNP